ncbi:hypothetical protein X740_24395 [Mesorhizobium sp. LNHC221B00]|nr:hypothetical protein X742_26605 [Mesorhizobium sp. LNHC232B00]ESY77425.1 hypothetical protein X740_24395 [Mesorhizobium sp. LNHC221B00]
MLDTQFKQGYRLWRCAMGLRSGGHRTDFSNQLRIRFFAAMDFAMNMRSTKTIWWWAC